MAPSSLAQHLRDRAAEVTDAIVALPRAAAITDEDARQFVHGLLFVVIEAADGTSTDARDTMLESLRDFVASGRPLADGIRGVSRALLFFSEVVVCEMPAAERSECSLWLAQVVADFLADVVERCKGMP